VRIAERAPAKANLVLHVGAPEEGGLHRVCSLFASLDLIDELLVEATGDEDRVVCPGVEGENLAARALAAFRAATPQAELPPLRVSIDKRIPVAAGLGGGSADAAAVLRALDSLAGRPLRADGLQALAADLGSDVPSQVAPLHALVTGTGELVEPLRLPPLAFVLVPQAQGLASAAVYAELDRLRQSSAVPDRPRLDPEPLRRLAAASAPELAAGLENDLEAAALALRPELERPLEALQAAGALGARLTGSGPTAFGLFPDREAAEAGARGIPGSIVAEGR